MSAPSSAWGLSIIGKSNTTSLSPPNTTTITDHMCRFNVCPPLVDDDGGSRAYCPCRKQAFEFRIAHIPNRLLRIAQECSIERERSV